MEQLVNAEELAEILRVPRGQVYRLTRRRQIPALSVGQYYRYNVAEVLAALRRPALREEEPDGRRT